MVCWMGERPAVEGRRYVLKQATRSRRTRCPDRVASPRRRRHVAQGRIRWTALALNDIGRVQLRANRTLVFDSYARNRVTGGFVLIDEATNDTVAAGMIVASALAAGVRSRPPSGPAPPT